MNNETFDNKNQNKTLFNINKTNETLTIKNSSKTIINNDQNEKDKFKISFIRSKTIKSIKSKNLSNKDNSSLFKKQLKKLNIKIINNNNDNNNNNPSEIKIVNDDGEQNSLTYKTNSTLNQNELKKNKSKKRLLNIKKYYKSQTSKLINNLHNSNKMISLNKIFKKNNESGIKVKKEDDNTNTDNFFSTEINEDFSSLKTNPNTNVTLNNINNYSIPINYYYQYKITDSKRNCTTDNRSKFNKYLHNDDPLLIQEEDKIFEEIKKYKCFKHFTKESLNKTGVPFIYIDMNMNSDTIVPLKDINNIDNKSYINNNENRKKNKSVNDKFIFEKKYKRQITEEKKKELLDKVYSMKDDPDFYKKIEILKQKKDKKKLKSYQNNFLKIVKCNISDKYYDSLKDKFWEIRELAEGKYKTNLKFLKEIEKNEEGVIKNINKICNYYMKYFETQNFDKYFLKAIGPKITLPKIGFIKMAKKNYFSENEKINKYKTKQNFISLRKNMNRTSTRFNKNSFGNSYRNKDIFFITNYNKFKSLSSKKI